MNLSGCLDLSGSCLADRAGVVWLSAPLKGQTDRQTRRPGAGSDSRADSRAASPLDPGTRPTSTSTPAQADGPGAVRATATHGDDPHTSTSVTQAHAQAGQPSTNTPTGRQPARNDVPEAENVCGVTRFVRPEFRHTGTVATTMRKHSLSENGASGFRHSVARARDWLKHHLRPTVIISIHGPDGLIETITCAPPWRVRLDGLLLRLRAPLSAFRRHGVRLSVQPKPAAERRPGAGEGGTP